MRIQYTHQAIRDLQRLHDFIAANNPKAGFEISEKIIQAVTRLIDFPLLGRQVRKNENPLGSMRDLVTGNYIIRYLVLSTEIHILRIWHGKEDGV